MTDVLYLALGIGVFAVLVLYVFGCGESVMSFDYAICAIAGVIALAYLLAAMLRPDKF